MIDAILITPEHAEHKSYERSLLSLLSQFEYPVSFDTDVSNLTIVVDGLSRMTLGYVSVEPYEGLYYAGVTGSKAGWRGAGVTQMEAANNCIRSFYMLRYYMLYVDRPQPFSMS